MHPALDDDDADSATSASAGLERPVTSRPMPSSSSRLASPPTPYTFKKAPNPKFVQNLSRQLFLRVPITLRLLNALNREDRGLKVRFSLATIVFDRFELILCQMRSSQGQNAPSNPYPHYLVRLAASRQGTGTCAKKMSRFGKRQFRTNTLEKQPNLLK